MQYDVLIISDLRFPGGTAAAIAHEIRALRSAGYAVCLLHKPAPVLKRDRPMNPAIRACIDAGETNFINGQDGPVEIGARLAVLHNPYVFASKEHGFPRVRAEHKVLVAHQPVLDGNGVPYYNVKQVHDIAESLVGEGVAWAPISPLSRSNLLNAGVLHAVLAEDWTNVIFTGEWATDRGAPAAGKPVIGRHSRPEWQKWPASREETLAVYPDSDEFQVRLLGVDDTLRRIVGEPLPSNWTAFGFGEVDPAEFLRSIDFFVYYHHPAWVEAFGRTIAEAAASGAVIILPDSFEPTFGEAALYRRPHEVVDTVRQLYDDWDEYRLQSRLGQRIVDRLYGPKRFLNRIAGLIGEPDRARSAAPERSHLPLEANDVTEKQFDIVHLGDLRTTRESAWRIANETRIQAESGYSTGLVHAMTAGRNRLEFIHPAIDALVRGGTAEPVDPATPVIRAQLLVVNGPEVLLSRMLEGDQITMPRIVAERVVAFPEVQPTAEELPMQDALLKAIFGQGLTWAAVNADCRQRLDGAHGVQPEGDIWSPSIPASMFKPRSRNKYSAAVVGVVVDNPSRLPHIEGEFLSMRSSARLNAVVRVLVPGTEGLLKPSLPDGWEVSEIDARDPIRELDKLDLVLVLPQAADVHAHVNLILCAMARGIPSVVPSDWQWLFRKAPTYGGWREAISLLDTRELKPNTYAEMCTETARRVNEAFGPGLHRARLHRLLAPAMAKRPSPAPVPNQAPARRRVLFFSSNGVGLGHLTRLLAIARRMGQEFEPVFATLSQAIGVVEQAGYPVEYLPFHVYANCDVNDWNGWTKQHISQILDFHRPAAVVFDGGMPYSGLLQAVACKPEIKLVWVRRGMWQPMQDNRQAIARQAAFDLIIEPSDIAEEADKGATASHRHTVLKVPPICLLEPSELLDRPSAAARFALDPDRPAVLIQLGSGWNRDIVSMIDALLRALAERPDVQPVLVEWLIAGTELDLWPGVRRVRGFPIAKYYNAFDFTVSAAGYNSFNEIISFGLPAILVANEHAMLDDQRARADFADEHCAAFTLPDNGLEAIERVVDLILDAKVRWLVKANCSRLAKGNGAGEAAKAIEDLLS